MKSTHTKRTQGGAHANHTLCQATWAQLNFKFKTEKILWSSRNQRQASTKTIFDSKNKRKTKLDNVEGAASSSQSK